MISNLLRPLFPSPVYALFYCVLYSLLLSIYRYYAGLDDWFFSLLLSYRYNGNLHPLVVALLGVLLPLVSIHWAIGNRVRWDFNSITILIILSIYQHFITLHGELFSLLLSLLSIYRHFITLYGELFSLLLSLLSIYRHFITLHGELFSLLLSLLSIYRHFITLYGELFSLLLSLLSIYRHFITLYGELFSLLLSLLSIYQHFITLYGELFSLLLSLLLIYRHSIALYNRPFSVYYDYHRYIIMFIHKWVQCGPEGSRKAQLAR